LGLPPEVGLLLVTVKLCDQVTDEELMVEHRPVLHYGTLPSLVFMCIPLGIDGKWGREKRTMAFFLYN